MEAFETRRKTLAEGRSLAAKPQAPDDKALKQASEASALPGSTVGNTGSGSGLEGSVARTQRNGVRVSDNTNGGVVGMVTTRIVETKISAERSFGGRNIDVSDGEDGVLSDAKVTGESSSSVKIVENEKGVEVEHGGRNENVKGLDSVLVVNKNEEQSVEKTVAGGDASGFIGDGPGKKAGSSANMGGPTSKIEVKEGRDLNKKRGYEDNGASLPENGGDPDVSMLEMSEKKDGEEEDVSDEEYEYSVGDFVWGKIKSHPWWPGQIYDPSDASQYAAKFSQRDRLLVAYFGDGTFAWCHPYQLKPFEENFEQMSKQINSKNFVNAVEGALDEFGKLTELEMTCSCVQKENQVGLTRPLAANAGIKEGVSVPEGGIGKHSISQFEPANFLANLRYIARVVSVTSVLELNVLKSKLSAFYRAKGGYQLPMYSVPQYIVGLEDKIRIGVMNNGECDVPIQGPSEEDWLSSPVAPGFDKISQSSMQKWPLISEDKLYQRRKQKSISEIMGGEMDVKPKKNEENMAKERTHSGKLSSVRRKKIKLSEAPVTTENEVRSVENAGGGTKKGPVLRKRKTKKSSSVENDGGGVKEESENGAGSRERKKSKYLSPPYTSPNRGERNSSSKRDSKTEFLKVSGGSRVGERMSRAAGQLIGSPPILKCSGETYQKNVSREDGIGRDTPGSLSPETPKQDQNHQIIDPMVTKASANEVLSEIRSAARNPLYTREAKSLDMIRRFFSAFRSSVYRNGSNYKMYNKRRRGRKRKSLDSEPGSLGKDLKQSDHNSLESKSRRMRKEKNEAKSDMPKLKQATRASDVKKNDKETEGKASSAALFLTYGSDVSLPSKDDLIATYSKFGSLNESETDVLYNSSCAQVVFVRSSDAEQAFNDSVRISSSGDSKVSYRLRYLSGTSRIRELDDNPHPKASSLPKEGGKTTENSSLQFVRQKLEMMTSMLEKSDGNMSQEMKINLESEMKGLLEKVSTMAESSSP